MEDFRQAPPRPFALHYSSPAASSFTKHKTKLSNDNWSKVLLNEKIVSWTIDSSASGISWKWKCEWKKSVTFHVVSVVFCFGGRVHHIGSSTKTHKLFFFRLLAAVFKPVAVIVSRDFVKSLTHASLALTHNTLTYIAPMDTLYLFSVSSLDRTQQLSVFEQMLEKQ